MAKLDANSEFEKGRDLSVPVVKVPRSVKEWLCIDRAYENGNFKIEPMTGEAMYDQSYVFEDINYVNKDTSKKDSTLLEIMTLLKSLDGPFKITLANEQRDLDSFVNEIFNPINGQEYPVVEKGIGKWINQKIDEGTRDIRKTMILTVTCRAHTLEEAEAYFATIDTTLSNIFRNLRSRIYKMSAEERMVLLSRMLRAGEECLPPARISPDDSGWKNQILPASIQSDTDYMVINNKQYVSVLVGTAFGQSLSEDKVIHSLSDVLFPTYITIDMQRVPKNVIHDRLENAHANNERVIAQERTRNYNNKQFGATTSYSLTKKKTSLEDDMDQLDENDEEGVFLGLLVLVYADSLEELTQRVDILRQKAKGSSYELEPYYHRQLAMLNICETAEVKRIFSGNDIDIREIGLGANYDRKTPVVLFLVMPDNVNTYTWIISMFYTQLFDVLVRVSDDEIKAPLPFEVQVWMDEFYAGARPADTEKLLGVIRSRNISAVIMLQSIAQAKAIFPNDKWEILMDNLATAVYLGSGPFAKSTHEFISEMLQSATADKRDDRLSYGMNQSSDLSYSKVEMKLMTPGQVKRMPPTECIVFFESRPPIYDTKAIPFDKPEYGFTAADWLKDRYSAAMALGDYEHPVRTIYDAKNFRYITLSRDKCLDFVTDREEIERLKVMAKTDRTIYSCEVDERDLLYLSFDSARKRSVDEIAELYRQAVKESDEEVEQIKGLALLHDVDTEELIKKDEETDKTGWTGDTFADLCGRYWDKLKEIEKEIISNAMDDGLNEEQMINIFLAPTDDMDNLRRAYVIDNKRNGDDR